MIRFDRVSKRYDADHEALTDITFDVGQGEALILTGHSGAGKSTLLKLVAGIEAPTAGSIMVNGQDLASLRRRQIPYLRRSIGMIFQDYRLLTDRSALDNVLLPLQISGLPGREALTRARAALDRVGLLALENAAPATLSGGEQQRLCIARAVVNRPGILLADEPTAHLDSATALDIFSMFQSFNEAGVTMIIATHHDHLAGSLNSRVLHLDHGLVARDDGLETEEA